MTNSKSWKVISGPTNGLWNVMFFISVVLLAVGCSAEKKEVEILKKKHVEILTTVNSMAPKLGRSINLSVTAPVQVSLKLSERSAITDTNIQFDDMGRRWSEVSRISWRRFEDGDWKPEDMTPEFVKLIWSTPPQLIKAKEIEQEVKNGLKSIFTSAISYFAENGTFDVNDIHKLQLELKDAKNYSIWYPVKGIPTAIPGSNQEKTPCDLTTPPTFVKVSATADKFVAAIKVNTGAATCDEWSINDQNLRNHVFDGMHR